MPKLDLLQKRIHYLYRWIRVDKNQPFYIGIGTVPLKAINSPELTFRYCRAFSNYNRTEYFLSIKKKSECFVEIMIETDDYEFIKQKEMEFIKLYGRKDKKTGILSNMSDGGDGNKGTVVSDKTRQLMSQAQKGNVKQGSIKALLDSNISKTKKILQYSLDGKFIEKWDNVNYAKEKYGFKKSNIMWVVRKGGNGHSAYGYMWKLYDGGVIDLYVSPYKKGLPNEKALLQIDDFGNTVKRWENLADANRCQYWKEDLKKCIKVNKKYKGFYWFFA